ncbi:TPA: hypothetical protein KPE15_000153 [Clostridioides difficile]|nr:hypothetical protein [Clostridioides difficile]
MNDLRFTFHIVNLKPITGVAEKALKGQFTFHIVNLKPQNKLSISNTYIYTILLKLQ